MVEMPASERGMQMIKGGQAAYRDNMLQARDLIAGYGVPVWLTTDLDLIPADGWGDTYHLHQSGAEIFSRWLGGQVGAAVMAGELPPLSG